MIEYPDIVGNVTQNPVLAAGTDTGNTTALELRQDDLNVIVLKHFNNCQPFALRVVIIGKTAEKKDCLADSIHRRPTGQNFSEGFITELGKVSACFHTDCLLQPPADRGQGGGQVTRHIGAAREEGDQPHQVTEEDEEEEYKSLKGKEEMVTKETEETKVTPEEEVEAKPEARSEEVAEETKEEIPEEEVTKEEPAKAPEVAKEEEPKELEQEAPTKSEEVPEVVERTFSDLLEEVQGLKVDGLTGDEIEQVYEAFSDVTEQIEAMVQEELKADVESSPAA